MCSLIGALVSVNDFAIRPARGLSEGETLSTGKYRYRFCSTAHLPHGWDAGLLFEETTRTLLCSDLFHHLIVDAIGRRDSGRAGRLMAEHIAQGRDAVLDAMAAADHSVDGITAF